ncbi:ABC transporter substrate-binding protein [Phycicoccus sp. 3266]|jgi:peptide/nickel transport system substrate-binding protein|uniref:ABC transporter substrate-binding protein n=1 Tax=Phycicoccus sp. 3266 TaxID=2817751 RepID=UPI0028543B23|nr:ABC transporter substrate-binding protein [Phycicoccus sp. 3266]MDR6863996.1 peptide/nickel transport system substrate-binding protein [Phycicoccus sp. 3266]
MKLTRKAAPVALATTLALSLAACAQSNRDNGSGSSGSAGNIKDTLTFGAAGAPELFDPFYATDGETFRVTRQMMEGLVGIKPGTADIEPELATKWESSSDGKEWTFTLRQGVKFWDGTPFNAAAVCYNFERMFDQNEVAAGGPAGYWADVMGSFKSDAKNALYQGCTAKDDMTAVIKISRPTSKFPTALSLDSFSMQSPKALKDGDANNVTKQGDGFGYPAYSKNPVGTGPYKLEKFDEANKTVTLVANDSYWGEKPKTKKIVFKIIPDESTRRQELEAGSIDGYDLPNPADWKGLKDSGNQLLIRPAFNILYVGLNPQHNPKLKDLKVRQALYYAMNRDQLVKTQLPEGATVATQFMPETVDGYNKSLQAYPYDPAKAKSLLKEAGAEGMTLNFAYPSDVSRPYMPNPQKIYEALRSDLENVGIKVQVSTKPWNGGYLDTVDNGGYDAWLLGWTGDYNSADNFIGTFFSNLKANDFHTSVTSYGAQLSKDLEAADSIVDEGQRAAAYEKINQQIQEDYLPGLAISHSPPALVVSSKVKGLVPSPLTAETFSTVTVSK